VPLLPPSVQAKIKTIDADNSTNSIEEWDKISDVLQNTYSSMDSDERSQVFNKIQQSVSSYDQMVTIESQTTVIHKISISTNGTIGYVARAEVPGTLLNQFSLDENGSNLRIATTSNSYLPYQGTSQQHNNVYVLDSEMKTIGKLENIAKGESVYSARFLGNRLYLVTYQSIDPFFVIDVSGSTPKVLGALYLPGYSEYLHPYDDTHIIGIGRETAATGVGSVINEGLKIALFDVSNVASPKLIDSYEIGTSAASSEALTDHKALLFDRAKSILVIPVTAATPYSGPTAQPNGVPFQPASEWYGFYVFGIDPKGGIRLLGSINHTPNGENSSSSPGYVSVPGSSRAFCIDDTLYTITVGNMLKANSLPELHELSTISLDSAGRII